MIAGWDDLAYNEDYERYGEFNELKAWLRSQTQESQTIITPTSHHLDLLRTALQAAIYEIRDNLDDQSKSAPTYSFPDTVNHIQFPSSSPKPTNTTS